LGLLLCAALPAEVKVFRNFTLIDGTGRAPAPASAMIVDNGRIAWVGPAAQLKAPAGAQTVDCSGKYIMPGIVNLHGHVGNVTGLKQDARFFTRENVGRNLKTYASYGVTTVVSMGTDQDLIFDVREQERAGRPAMARVLTAGQGFVFQGGYGGLAGVTPEVSTPAEVEKVMAHLAARKADFVKLWMDDHLGAQKKMPYDLAKAIIDSGHRHRLRVLAHIFYLEDARRLVDLGIDGLAHSVRDKPIDQALIDSMKKHGTWQMAPTLSREASMFIYGKTPPFAADPFFTRGVPADVVRTLQSPEYQKGVAADPHFGRYPAFLETAKKNLKALADAGVPYAFGTDSGPPGRFPGFFEHWELELMTDAGLTPSEALAAATGRAAQFLGTKDVGTLEPGKWADLLILHRDPLANIRNTRSIQAVYIAGNEIKR
jgi:imidazolonepropionase-like amidohydrolase